jgi:predicted DNA-binding protein
VKAPDFEKMTKDEVIAWFRTSTDLSPLLASMTPATEPASRPEAPMMLASIRLPVDLMEQLDQLAALHGVRRSDVIRDALAAYVTEHTGAVDRDEAERALEVLRRIVASHNDPTGQAA